MIEQMTGRDSIESFEGTPKALRKGREMLPGKVHFYVRGARVDCGQGTRPLWLSRRYEEVTCHNCKRTYAYSAAKRARKRKA